MKGSMLGSNLWMHECIPAEPSDDNSQEEDMGWIGHVEELSREGRLVRRFCEGARDALHVRSRLEVRAGARVRRTRLPRAEATRPLRKLPT